MPFDKRFRKAMFCALGAVQREAPDMADGAPSELDPETVYVFTDGSFRSLGGVGYGGWAAILMKGQKRKELSGAARDTTVNRMELTAVLEAIKALNPRDTSAVRIYSDSAYTVNCVTSWGHSWARKGWVTSEGKEVANRDLIEEILRLFEGRMRIGWVKGHSKHEHNDNADALARDARVALEEADAAERETAHPVRNIVLEEDTMDEILYGSVLAKAIRASRGRTREVMQREAAERLAARAPPPRKRLRRAHA